MKVSDLCRHTPAGKAPGAETLEIKPFLPLQACGKGGGNVGREGQKQSAARRLPARPVCGKSRFQQE